MTDGLLDPTFSTDGKQEVDFTPVKPEYSGGEAMAVAVQADRRIVVAGMTQARHAILVTRLNINGSLDTSFDKDGRSEIELSGNTSIFDGNVVGVFVLSSGKIVVAGSSESSFFLARFNANGAPDTGFGGNGLVETRLDGLFNATAAAIQQDGKILIAGTGFFGTSSFSDTVVARLKTDGSLDTAFDGDGYLYPKSTMITEINAIGVREGKIYLAGSVITNSGFFGWRNFSVIRIKADGALDTTFSDDGQQTISFQENNLITWNSEAHAIAFQGDKIVVAGSTSFDMAVARLNANGSLDTSFSDDGKIIIDMKGFSQAEFVAVQSNGRILVGGWGIALGETTFQDFAIARLTTTGALDTTFSDDGRHFVDFSPADQISTDYAHAMVLQNDGKIVLAGRSNHLPEGTQFAVARLRTSGTDTDTDPPGNPVTPIRPGINPLTPGDIGKPPGLTYPNIGVTPAIPTPQPIGRPPFVPRPPGAPAPPVTPPGINPSDLTPPPAAPPRGPTSTIRPVRRFAVRVGGRPTPIGMSATATTRNRGAGVVIAGGRRGVFRIN